MGVWSIAATVIAGWCVVSVLFGVVLGHAMSGRSLRRRLAPVESAVGAAVEAVTAPVAMLGDALSSDDAALDAAV